MPEPAPEPGEQPQPAVVEPVAEPRCSEVAAVPGVMTQQPLQLEQEVS